MPSERAAEQWAQVQLQISSNSYARDYHPGLYGMRPTKLYDAEEQENDTGQVGVEKILSILQKTYPPQRDEIGTMK